MSAIKSLDDKKITGAKDILKILEKAFPKLSEAVSGVSAAFKSAQGGVNVFKAAGSGLKNIITAHPYVTLAIAIIGVASAFKSLSTHAINASQKAKESAEKALDSAKSHDEEREHINELIEEYAKLKENGITDSESREKIRDIQKEIINAAHFEGQNRRQKRRSEI